MFDIVWQPKALKQLKKIKAKPVAHSIYRGVGTLRHYPNVANIKKLKNHKYEFRLRVKCYRIFFNVRNDIEIIDIEEVKKRDERTY